MKKIFFKDATLKDFKEFIDQAGIVEITRILPLDDNSYEVEYELNQD